MPIPRLIVPVLLAVLALAGCEQKTDSRVGQWKLDAPAMKAQFSGEEGMPESFMLGMIEQMDFKLETRADGTFEIRAKIFGEEDHVTGSWTATDDGMVMTNETKNGEPADQQDTADATLIDADHFRIGAMSDDEPDLYFVRIADAG